MPAEDGSGNQQIARYGLDCETVPVNTITGFIGEGRGRSRVWADAAGTETV